MRMTLILLLYSISAIPLIAQVPDTTWSTEAIEALQNVYPDWRLQNNYGQSYVQGDFDGDGYLDHALHISYSESSASRKAAQALVAVFEDPDTVRVVFLEDAAAFMSLHLVEQGGVVCAVHTTDCFELAVDAIEVGYEEKASWIHVWDGAAFVQIETGD